MLSATLTIIATTNQAMMSSREIAELTGKKHPHIMRDIRVILEQLYGIKKDDPNLVHNKNQTVKLKKGVLSTFDHRGYMTEISLDRRHTEILITGYDIKRRAAVIDRWFELESKNVASQPQVPQSFSEALMLAAKLAKDNELLADQRDEAIRTKAQISDKREATACQRNSVYQRIANRAIREREEMAARFGASKEWASQQAMWRATGKMFGWNALNAWLDQHDIHDPLTDCYPTGFNPEQNSREVIYPRQAWFEVYGVDIAEIF